MLSGVLPPPPPPLPDRPLQDPILRYGGMFVIGLAYCGTSNNAAIQKLLHFAVSGAPCLPAACGLRGLRLRPGLRCAHGVLPALWKALPLGSQLTHGRAPPSPPDTHADVSNDVRRAAVMNLGFVLAAAPEQCPKIVALLAESYNPHVR